MSLYPVHRLGKPLRIESVLEHCRVYCGLLATCTAASCVSIFYLSVLDTTLSLNSFVVPLGGSIRRVYMFLIPTLGHIGSFGVTIPLHLGSN